MEGAPKSNSRREFLKKLGFLGATAAVGTTFVPETKAEIGGTNQEQVPELLKELGMVEGEIASLSKYEENPILLSSAEINTFTDYARDENSIESGIKTVKTPAIGAAIGMGLGDLAADMTSKERALDETMMKFIGDPDHNERLQKRQFSIVSTGAVVGAALGIALDASTAKGPEEAKRKTLENYSRFVVEKRMNHEHVTMDDIRNEIERLKKKRVNLKQQIADLS